jgi:hypothetical protein
MSVIVIQMTIAATAIKEEQSGNQSTRGTDHLLPFTKTSRRRGPASTIYLSGGLSLDHVS